MQLYYKELSDTGNRLIGLKEPLYCADIRYKETRTVNGDTQPVKVCKRSFGLTNNVDYEIYYLKNCREW